MRNIIAMKWKEATAGMDSHQKVATIIRGLSWLLVPVAMFSVIMTYLSTYSIWVTDLFSNARANLWVLLVTFLIWSLRGFLDSRVYPVFRTQGWIFFILAAITIYLLTTSVF
ncbi:hypothetical protein ABB02_01742 [Clostridiaceae bacterium JG1575]|nr:hypothetical protein ABB02_01742 [Clostridiaceae bacterium JG1575]